MLYVILLVAFFVFFLGAALVFLSGAVSFIVAVLKRRWGVAGIAAALMVVTGLPAFYTFSVLDGLAWPGRFEPLPTDQFVGSYLVVGSEAGLDLHADGNFEATATGWSELPADGTWSWHEREAWGPVEQAGYVHLQRADRVVAVLHARRDAELMAERLDLAGGSEHPTSLLPLRRLEPE